MNQTPKTPFSAPLSGSAKETKMRLMNVMKWKKSRPPMIALALILCVTLACCSLVACQNNGQRSADTNIPKEVQQFYVDYLEISKISVSEAVNQYCHYEIPEHKEMALDSTVCLDDYKNLEFTKLSDDLWATSVEIVDEYYPQGALVYNYVGNIDGKYYVMTSDKQIPEKLKLGIDFSDYTYNDDDIL